MDGLNSIIDLLNQWIWSTPSGLPWLVVALLGTGLFITVRLAFIQLRQVGHALRVVRGVYDDEHDDGDINHFQALTTALSGTVGIGNIAGVATAIHYGGPGALFWMWLTAFFGMALKFSECTLALKYRSFDNDGHVAGGPMYYIEKGLGSRFKPLAMAFAFCGILSSFCTGNMNQANTIAVSAQSDFGVGPQFVAVIAVTFVGIVILGGIRRIGSVTGRLAPLMALIYVGGALIVLILNADRVPGTIVTIVSSAFNPQASLGGSVAGVWSATLLWGVKRGLFSNEAGQGSAPIAHAAARTHEPVREGAVALLEPLIDTLIICTMTGLVIVTTGVWDDKVEASYALNRAKLLPAEHVKSGASSEYERIAQAEAEASRLRDKGAESLYVEFRDGRQGDIAFVVADALVVEPRLVDADGAFYSGTLLWDRSARSLKSTQPSGSEDLDSFTLQGRMLQNSSSLTALGFKRGLSPIGNGGNYIVTFCVFLFGLSTMISWSYYGDRCATYLFGSKSVLPYRVIFCGVAGVGALVGLETVWAIGDIALGLMALPNLIAIVLLNGTTKKLSTDYFMRMKSGDPASGSN